LRLVELPAPVLACIGGMDKQVNLARARGRLNPVGAIDQVSGASLHPEPVERRLPKGGFGPLCKIGRDRYVA
jgi:hypothetical protein